MKNNSLSIVLPVMFGFLAYFWGIVVLVAADVAVNMTLPRLMTDQFGLSTEKANLCNSLYFLARTVAAFAGVWLYMLWLNRRIGAHE